MSPMTVPPSEDRASNPIDLAEAGMTGLLDAAPLAGLDLPCRSAINPDLWFAEAPTDLERAKQFCDSCPVRVECLAGAVARHEPWGVWGGEIFERGVVIARKRPRGRPRKDQNVPVNAQGAAA
jgi:WhiB family redox-sensing transcriptional regulator